jgi:hypothetical protein
MVEEMVVGPGTNQRLQHIHDKGFVHLQLKNVAWVEFLAEELGYSNLTRAGFIEVPTIEIKP